MTQRRRAGHGCASEATQRPLQERPAGFAINTWTCRSDTGRLNVETPRRLMAPSTPRGARRPQPLGIVRTQARPRPPNILTPTTVNLLLDTEAAEQHRWEREPASPSPVTGPGRVGSGCKVHRGGVTAGTVAVPRDAGRPSEILLSALLHMSANEDLTQENLHQSLSPRMVRPCSPFDCSTPHGGQSEQCRKSVMSASGFSRARHAAEVVAAAATGQPMERSVPRPATAPGNRHCRRRWHS